MKKRKNQNPKEKPFKEENFVFYSQTFKKKNLMIFFLLKTIGFNEKECEILLYYTYEFFSQTGR